MQFLRRFRKLIALAALVWLPMSVYAQVCATHVLVANIGGPQHPALIAPEEMRQIGHNHGTADVAESVLVVVDAATFWQSVDDYDAGCDMKSVCAFASLAAVVYETSEVVITHDTPVPPVGEIAFATRSLTPDTPPPRLTP
jgi:hypothetical protein